MRNYNNGMFQKKFKLKMHFCLRIFSQNSYEKDKKGRKRLAVQGSRVDYTSLFEKVSKSDLENLKFGLEATTNCSLVGLLTDNQCIHLNTMKANCHLESNVL